MAQALMPRMDRGLSGAVQIQNGADDWLAEELHDGVAQSLWFLGVELSALNREISPCDTRLRKQVETLGEVAQEAYEQVRAILEQAWCAGGPAESISIDELVRREVKAFQDRTGTPVRLSLDSAGLKGLPREAHHVAAVLREALCNAWRHGHAGWVRVELRATEKAVSLTVSDRGVGFDPRVSREGHYGMTTMRKRAQALEGSLEVLAKVGRGVRVKLTFPREVLEGWNQKKRCSDVKSHTYCG
jgi:two-component system, NarL family, nitrate/nitrite sensor histidine kinase NarX